MDTICRSSYLYYFSYVDGAIQNIVYLYFSTQFVKQNFIETKDISAKEEKNPKS